MSYDKKLGLPLETVRVGCWTCSLELVFPLWSNYSILVRSRLPHRDIRNLQDFRPLPGVIQDLGIRFSAVGPSRFRKVHTPQSRG